MENRIVPFKLFGSDGTVTDANQVAIDGTNLNRSLNNCQHFVEAYDEFRNDVDQGLSGNRIVFLNQSGGVDADNAGTRLHTPVQSLTRALQMASNEAGASNIATTIYTVDHSEFFNMDNTDTGVEVENLTVYAPNSVFHDVKLLAGTTLICKEIKGSIVLGANAKIIADTLDATDVDEPVFFDNAIHQNTLI